MLSGLLITLNVLVCVALIAVVLLQRSEGGAFGMGGGPTGLITARGAGDLLTRTTWVLFTLFLALSLGLTLLGAHDRGASSVFEKLKGQKLNPMAVVTPQVPTTPTAPLPGTPSAPLPAAPIMSAPPAAPPAAPEQAVVAKPEAAKPVVKPAAAKAVAAKHSATPPAQKATTPAAPAANDTAHAAPAKSDATPPPAAPPADSSPKPDASSGSPAPQ